MAHHHGHAHLVPRQRDGREGPFFGREGPNVVVTSVKVVMAPNPFAALPDGFDDPSNTNFFPDTDVPVMTLIPPAIASRPASAVTTPAPAIARPTSKPAQASIKASIKASSTVASSRASSAQDSTLMVATKAPTSSPAHVAATFASSSATISATISATAAADSSQGMSTGVMAGIVFGSLVVVGTLLVGILVIVYRRKKNQAPPAKDDEKLAMQNAPPPIPQTPLTPTFQFTPAPGPESDPSIRTARSGSAAPRLSLRSLTQFDPGFDNGKSSPNLLGVVHVGSLSPNKERGFPESPRGWERPGAASAENPFKDPQQSAPPSTNPFGNDAAVDASQAKISDSPPNHSPLHSTNPSVDHANPATATAMSSIPASNQNLAAPPTTAATAAASEGSSPSPSWIEDLPASPGPAPTGALPVAGSPGPNNVHRVQLDFQPTMQDELGLNAGQLVRMLHEYDDGWALCIRMDRSQQGVVPRTCLSKHPVKPRNGPPRGPPPPGMRGPPPRSPMGFTGGPQPHPLSPANGPNGRMSPAPRAMSPGPRQMPPRERTNSNAPQYGPPRERSNSNAPPYAGPPRSMSPGPYGGGPQMAPPPQMGRPRSNSASQTGEMRRGPAPGPSPMNPNNGGPTVERKPVPGMAM
ncbi:hypothetical protein ACEQ8H_007715 [Pleosporales sp. CAS-2024a]